MTTITRNEVEQIIEQVNNQTNSDTELPNWNYWRDSGNVNCWLSDNWLLQVGHSIPVIALGNLDKGKAVTGEPGNEDTAVTFLAAAIANPTAALDHLREQEGTLPHSSSVIIDEEQGRAVGHIHINGEGTA